MAEQAFLAYLNGRFVPQTEATLPLHDAGFVMGATVTDFCRTFNHALFRWPDHLARLRRDCETCFIPLVQSDDVLTGAAEELVRRNAALIAPGQELALITFATPGPIGYYLGEAGGAGDGPPTLGMHTFRLPLERYRRFFTEGIALAVPSSHALSPVCMYPQVKHRSRLHWWVAEQRLRSEGHPAGIFALLRDSWDGNIAETAIGNFLLVKDGQVRTPRRKCVLDGISLRVVEELCGRLGVPFAEADVLLDDVRTADEAMLCGTAFCLAGVSRVQVWTLPWPGPVFTRLLKAWSDLVGIDIARQFLPSP
jgi:branched-subunit amino acid aminotransferase/4-amino-4-deoxychorismate lyase